MPFVIQETAKLYVKKKKVISVLVKTCKQNQKFFWSSWGHNSKGNWWNQLKLGVTKFLNTFYICANSVKNQKRSRYFLVDLAWNDPIVTDANCDCGRYYNILITFSNISMTYPITLISIMGLYSLWYDICIKVFMTISSKEFRLFNKTK